jgi:D-sedoheptulose 7-phosphate isomerase
MKNLKKTKKFSNFSENYFQYLNKVFSKIDKRNLDNLTRLIDLIRKKKRTLFVIGNGGGASTSTTVANDLGFDLQKKTKTKNPLIVHSLTDNNSLLTAISNDTGFENVFIGQLNIYFKKGDCLLIFSASGNSKNLIKAANFVKKRNSKVIGILGFDGGKLKNLCDICIHIPTEKGEYGPVEDIQLMLNHMLAHWYQAKN